MLDEICAYLRNWFELEKHFGSFTISGGTLEGFSDKLLDGQHFRIVRSVFNDGIHQYPATDLKDETFIGAVWAMAVPPAVLSLAEEIAAWVAKYGGTDSAAMSPFNSESFGGYSYSKSAGASASDGSAGNGNTWKAAFAARLAPWRKL